MTKKQRRALYKKQCKRCPYCGGFLGSRRKFFQLCSVDHVVPLCKGGSNRMTNKVMVHRTCNRKKGGRFPTDREIKALWAITGIKTVLGLFADGPRVPYNKHQQEALLRLSDRVRKLYA